MESGKPPDEKKVNAADLSGSTPKKIKPKYCFSANPDALDFFSAKSNYLFKASKTFVKNNIRYSADVFLLNDILAYSHNEPPTPKENYLKIGVVGKLFSLVKRIFDLNIFGFAGLSVYFQKLRANDPRPKFKYVKNGFRKKFKKRSQKGGQQSTKGQPDKKFPKTLDKYLRILSTMSTEKLRDFLGKQELFLAKAYMGTAITVPPNSNTTIPALIHHPHTAGVSEAFLYIKNNFSHLYAVPIKAEAGKADLS